MRKAFKIGWISLIVIGLLALLGLYVSTHPIPVLEPKGYISLKQRELILTVTLLMLIVVIPVFVLTFIFGLRYRENNKKAKYRPEWDHSSIAECCWWGVPLIIIIILAVMTWRTSHELNPYKPIHNGKPPLEIQVVALNWKWLFIYPKEGIATVNFVQFPTRTPINFVITADAPMNSFWIPQLGGQIYAMPAMRTQLHLLANEIGSYKGLSANISGTGFAGMTFTAKTSSDEEFEAWVQTVKCSEKVLNREAYDHLALPTEYHPVETYVLRDQDLFQQIIMKYMPQ